VAALVEGLGDVNPGVQEAVMNALVRISGPRVVSSLVPLLRRDATTRNLAVEALEQIGGTALDVVLPLTTHPDLNVRKFIVDTLGKLGDHRAVPVLRSVLRDPDANVRASAAEALGALGAQDALPDLLAMLKDDEWVVFSVVEALGRLGCVESIAPLLELLRAGAGPIRHAVIEALGRFPKAEACLAPMLELLPGADADLKALLTKSIVSLASSCGYDLNAGTARDALVAGLRAAAGADDPEIVLAAFKGYAMVGDPAGAGVIVMRLERTAETPEETGDELFEEAAPALVRCADETTLMAALESPVGRVAMLAADVLGSLRAKIAVTALSRLAGTHADRGVRLAAVEALGRIGDASSIGAVIVALDDETGYVRGAAAAALAVRGEPGAIAPLCRRLAVERYADVRAAIVNALCAVPQPQVVGRFVALLKHDRDDVRESAARGLGKLRAPAASSDLRDAVNDPSWAVRAAAVEAVGGYPTAEAYDTLRLALSDDHEKVRLAAVRGLAGRPEPEAVEVLRLHALADEDVWVRYRAIEALGAKRSAAAVPSLLDLITNDRAPGVVRRMAVQALGLIGDPGTTDAIKGLLEDRDPEVAAAAGEALDALLGGGEGADPWS
jgi:HEAT repeat protein